MTGQSCAASSFKVPFLACLYLETSGLVLAHITLKLPEALCHNSAQDIANYMRNDEKRAYGTVIAGGEAAEAKVGAGALRRWLAI